MLAPSLEATRAVTPATAPSALQAREDVPAEQPLVGREMAVEEGGVGHRREGAQTSCAFWPGPSADDEQRVPRAALSAKDV